jgi:hypothetical protein
MSEQTGLSINKIKKMLAERSFTRYDPDKKATYRATILADAEVFQRVEKQLSETPQPEPCPIPDCEGTKLRLRDRAEAWECSTGGRRHYWATFVAKATKNDPKDVLVTLTDMKEQQEKRDAIARKLWHEEMEKREEKTTSQ